MLMDCLYGTAVVITAAVLLTVLMAIANGDWKGSDAQ